MSSSLSDKVGSYTLPATIQNYARPKYGDIVKERTLPTWSGLPEDNAYLKQSQSVLQPAVDYWTKVASGDRAAMAEAMAPQSEQLAKWMAQGKETIMTSVPRGAARDFALSQLPTQAAAQAAKSLGEARQQAFQQLPEISKALAEQGLTMRGQDVNALLQKYGYDMNAMLQLRSQDIDLYNAIINDIARQEASAVEQRGQDIQGSLTARGQDVELAVQQYIADLAKSGANRQLLGSIIGAVLGNPTILNTVASAVGKVLGIGNAAASGISSLPVSGASGALSGHYVTSQLAGLETGAGAAGAGAGAAGAGAEAAGAGTSAAGLAGAAGAAGVGTALDISSLPLSSASGALTGPYVTSQLAGLEGAGAGAGTGVGSALLSAIPGVAMVASIPLIAQGVNAFGDWLGGLFPSWMYGYSDKPYWDEYVYYMSNLPGNPTPTDEGYQEWVNKGMPSWLNG